MWQSAFCTEDGVYTVADVGAFEGRPVQIKFSFSRPNLAASTAQTNSCS
jgi:hypothetical protein